MDHAANPNSKEGIGPNNIPDLIEITVKASTSIIFDRGVREFVRLCVNACRETATANAKAFLEKYG